MIHPPPMELLLNALQASWGEDTAQNPNPSRGPASGQCVVSSMIVQDYYGGYLLKAEMSSASHHFGLQPSSPTIVHYWNQLPGGIWLDTTRDQFETWWVPTAVVIRPPDYLYKFEDTVKRYKLLKSRVVAYIEERTVDA